MILKMITRKNELTITLLFLTTLRLTNCYNLKSYDNNDWIPINQPDHKIQKKAVERVLTIPEQAALRFFPEEYRNTRQAEYQQQYLREISNQAQQRPHNHHHHNTKQQFTPQQLEQYYIDQRKKLNEQRNLQQALNSHQQENLKPYSNNNNNVNVQSQNHLLKQTYESLPREYLHPPSPQQVQLQPLSHHYLFPSNPSAGVQLVQENKGNRPISLTQLIQQPPGINGTVGFYNDLNQNYNNVPKTQPIELTTSRAAPVKEDNVQLLYLPIEQIQSKPKEFTTTLQQNRHILHQPQQPIQQPQQFQQTQQFQQPQIIQNVRPTNLNYNQQKDYSSSNNNNQEALLRNIQNDFIQQALQAHKLQQQLEQEAVTPEVTVVKKRKPHQPPLAVYMNGQERVHVTDVVKALKDSKTINVQDTIGPDSPHVFVGPANLNPPHGFSKFELPYLSNIENNRVERKVDQYPFFVAPLNYKTLPGYEKIPFPPPHVGSVVLNVNSLERNQHKPTLDVESNLTPTRINFNDDKDDEVVHVSTKRPIRQRGRHRTTTPPSLETTSYDPPSLIYNNVQLTSTSPGNIQKPVSPQTQFNQNRYYPGINLDDFREYQVEKSNYQPIQEVSNQDGPKQLFKYLETNSENSGIYNIHDSPPEKRKPNPEKPTVISTPVYEHKLHNHFANPFYNPISTTPSTTTTTTTQQPKLEEFIRLVKVSEEMVIRPQSNDPPPKGFVLLQNEKEDEPQTNQFPKETSLINKHSKQYLPINQGSIQNIPQVNYDHLFEAPFVTNSEVNQINSAAKSTTTEIPEKVKYIVLEEYPVKENLTKPLKYSEEEEEEKDSHPIYILKSHQNSDLNDLADPSIRQLLTPSLLAPSGKIHSSINNNNDEEVVPKNEYTLTTPEPTYKEDITTTTPKVEISKVRTRGRGGSRYTDRTSTYAPRNRVTARTRVRQRPLSTTTTTTEDNRDFYVSTPTPRIASTRQRFRNRGRPMISQGYSSTISNVQHTPEPTTEAAVEEIKKEEPKYEASFTEENLYKPQLIIKGKTLSPEEEYLTTKYNLSSFSTPESKSEKYNVEIVTEKIDEPTTVYSSTPEYVRSIHRSEKPRIRQRLRSKSRTTTVRTTTTTTTEAPEETSNSNEQEFYGFFRQPNFKTTTEESKISPTPKLLLQLEENSSPRSYNEDYSDERIQIISNGKEETPKPIQFIGEILPKYTTTEKYFEITPELAPINEAYIMTTISPPTSKRARTRGRYTTRKTIEHNTEEEYDSVPISSIRTEDRATHPPRTRSRGRSHFKLPAVLTSVAEEDNNNYPALYLKAQHDQESYTPQTSPQSESFKITVDPLSEDDDELNLNQSQDNSQDQNPDQEPHASAISSKYIAPSNNFFHTTANPKELKYIGGKNIHLNGTNFRANLTTIKLIDVELETTEKSSSPKRRGYWKLIKKKNPEEFEEAESQNVGVSRDNLFEEVDVKHRILAEDEESEDVGVNKREEDVFVTESSIIDNVQTENIQKSIDDDDVVVTDDKIDEDEEVTINPSLMKDLQTSTSTSTEISRDAEICSKGICVKQEDYDSDK